MSDAHYLCLRTEQAAKATSGHITYALLRDEAAQELYFTITDNDGGGYYSREIVPVSKVLECIARIPTDKPIAAKLFADAFVGRSSNNPGFLVAALKREGLLSPAGDASHLHMIAGDWRQWRSEQLQLQGEPFTPASPKSLQAKSSTSDMSERSANTETLGTLSPQEDAAVPKKRLLKLKRKTEQSEAGGDAPQTPPSGTEDPMTEVSSSAHEAEHADAA